MLPLFELRLSDIMRTGAAVAAHDECTIAASACVQALALSYNMPDFRCQENPAITPSECREKLREEAAALAGMLASPIESAYHDCFQPAEYPFCDRG